MNRTLLESELIHFYLDYTEDFKWMQIIFTMIEFPIINIERKNQIQELDKKFNYLFFKADRHFIEHPEINLINIQDLDSGLPSGAITRNEMDQLKLINQNLTNREKRSKDLKEIFILNNAISLMDVFFDKCFIFINRMNMWNKKAHSELYQKVESLFKLELLNENDKNEFHKYRLDRNIHIHNSGIIDISFKEKYKSFSDELINVGYYKSLNDPENYIEEMFKICDSIINSANNKLNEFRIRYESSVN